MRDSALEGLIDRRVDRFRLFNARGGKFRVAVTNVCNLDCFFCHNEAMANPRRLAVQKPVDALGTEELVGIVNAYCALGGKQVNLTGGEPLARPDLVELIEAIDKRGTKLCLNSNALLYRKLTRRPRVEKIDTILASLHTTDDGVYRDELGGKGRATDVVAAIRALSAHGYRVSINYSLGSYNERAFREVLEIALRERIELKAIALVRPNEATGFYGGPWVNPEGVAEVLNSFGARRVDGALALGGYTTTYDVDGLTVKVKNIARGRLRTDHCRGCLHRDSCGEGIYGLRVGVDGWWKPCLLRRERFTRVEPSRSYTEQILDHIDAMVGAEERWEFEEGAPR